MVVDDDFSWSDAPAPRRRTAQRSDSRRGATGTIVIGRGDWSEDQEAPIEVQAQDDSYEIRATRGEGVDPVFAYDYPEAVADDGYSQPAERSLVYAEAADADGAGTGRRTVVITGRGAERYVTPRRRRDSDVAFYQRGNFRPDSVAMWAVLLGIALLLGSIAH